jgi:hypothetical protein
MTAKQFNARHGLSVGSPPIDIIDSNGLISNTSIPNLDASKITSGTIDSARLPSYVDDVLEAANLAAFPATGETGKIYVALDTNKVYRWSGSVYVYITSGAVDSVAGKTGVVTLAATDVGLDSVENKSSATIRGEITSGNVTSALGFTPYNSTNPSGYITSAGTAANVSGTVAVANGGTGATSLTANNVLLGNGTSALQVVAPGTAGNVLSSNGTTWASTALPAGGLTYIYTTTAVTATDKQGVLTSTAGGAFTVTLPATPAIGAQVVVADAGSSWSTNNLTVGRNGSTIGGLAENLVCDITGASVQFVYDGTTWEVYTQIGGQGGNAVTLDGAQTLTNKTISGTNNTLSNISLTASVTGILPAANGGTGITSPGTAGNVLTSNGTTWTSAAPTGGGGSIEPAVGTLQYFSGEYSSGPAQQWYYRNPSFITGFLSAIAFGNNTYVAGSNFGAIATSTDLWTWTTRTSGSSANIRRLFYGNNLFIRAGSSGVLATSTDGITWTLRTSGTSSIILSLTYANGVYVYGTSGGGIATSTDAITWTTRTSGAAVDINGLAYGNGVFVYVGNSGEAATSTDAITWTARNSGTASNILDVAFGGGVFVYGGANGVMRSSTDGITWTARTSNINTNIRAVTYGAGTFVGAGATGNYSYDGVNWTAINFPVSAITSTSIAVTHGNGYFAVINALMLAAAPDTAFPGAKWLPCNGGVVNTETYPALAQKVGSSRRGPPTSWAIQTSGTTSNINALVYGGTQFVYAGDGGVLATSTNSTTWTARTSGTTSIIRALAFASNTYVYAGDGGIIGNSTDANTWTLRSSGTTSIIRCLAFGNGTFVYGGDGGVLGTSTNNGASWIARTSGTLSTISGIAYGNGLFVYGVNTNAIGTSTDGVTWTFRILPVPSNNISTITSVSFVDGIFIITTNAQGGINGVPIFTSVDGIDWVPRPSYASQSMRAAAGGGGAYTLAGSTGVIQTSGDGLAWTLQTSGTTSQINACAYGVLISGNFFVYAGAGGVVASSQTGGLFQNTAPPRLPLAVAPATNSYNNGSDQLYIKALP